MSSRIIEGLHKQREQHLANAALHQIEADNYRERMREQNEKATDYRARAWECEQAIEKLQSN